MLFLMKQRSCLWRPVAVAAMLLSFRDYYMVLLRVDLQSSIVLRLNLQGSWVLVLTS